MEILTGKQLRPRRVMLYGPHGVGKSSWAAAAPSPIFFDLEDGLGDIDCAHTPVLRDYGQIEEAISFLITQDHPYRTLVVDTVDWLETLVLDYVARQHGKRSIEEIGYGKGYTFALDKWERILGGFTHLRDQRKMGIILLAHAKVAKVKDPGMESYDRYTPGLHDSASLLIQEWCDEVLFANYRVFTRAEDQGFNKTRSIALGGKDRVVHTTNSAAFSAKNRLGLPDEIPMAWPEYAKHLGSPGNIPGMVVNGSSKQQEKVTNGQPQ